MKAAILGATGIIGQQFARLLANHPKFELTHLYASERSEGKNIDEIWQLPFFDCPEELYGRKIENLDNIASDVDIVFSALPKSVALSYESGLREQGIKVYSNAGSHRMDEDVPILIPEINGPQIELAKIQQENYGTEGFIITNSNCSAAGAATYLFELDKIQSISTAVVTTYQALSGAGIGGVSAIDISGNVIPYIGNEEPKIIGETKKMLGSVEDGKIKYHPIRVIANAARVDVVDGHLEAITSLFEEPVGDDVIAQLKEIQSPLEVNNYHIAPKTHLSVFDEVNRPQPKLDVFRSDKRTSAGMTVHVGRLRSLDQDLSAYILVHNTLRGGAGGSVLNAEYALQKGYM